ncbi:amino acid permease [Sporomusaceae bacterium FL31]|nr:amino acid permease [Sporomusaceae bacterium FL31]GCE35518.1 amino acid permease [Sporomusaceae bacterium]
MSVQSEALRRELGWLQGAAMTVGAVLGSGVLVLPVSAAQIAGPASLISWLLMGLLAIPLATVLGILGSNYPDAGGIASYTKQAFGDKAGAVTGFLFLGTVPIGGPVVALIGANYIGTLLSLTQPVIYSIAAVMLLLALFFNYRGIHLSGQVQVGIILVITIVLLAASLAALPHIKADYFKPFAPYGWLPVGKAMATLFWAFVGWEMIVHLAEEFKNPAKDIPRSLGSAIGLTNVLYLMVAFATIGTGAYLGTGSEAALAVMIGQGWGELASLLTGILGFTVCYGTVHTYIAGFSRLVYSQARDGYFPGYFNQLSSRYATPGRVLICLAGVFVLVLLLNYLIGGSIGFLMQWPSAIFIALYILAMAASLKLFYKNIWLRCCALISLVICIVIYTFTGWIGLYPLLVGLIGWQAISKK